MTILLVCLAAVAAVAVFGLVVWAGTAMVRTNDGPSAGVGNAFGSGLADFFDPGAARSTRDLQEQWEKTEVAPTPTGDDRPMRVDLTGGTVRIRRP